jgi:hypothetical protein
VCPRIDDIHVLVEDLHAVIRAIGDEEPALRVEREAGGPMNSPGFRPCRPNSLMNFPSRVNQTRRSPSCCMVDGRGIADQMFLSGGTAGDWLCGRWRVGIGRQRKRRLAQGERSCRPGQPT